jgi:hypothetical protein
LIRILLVDMVLGTYLVVGNVTLEAEGVILKLHSEKAYD